MDCIQEIKSIEDCKILVERIRERRIFYSNISEHFRGQGRANYELVPNIARNLKNAEAIKSKEISLINFVKSEIENLGLEKIIRSDTYLNDKQNIWNLLFQAQHLGIPTRLLDWTMNWEVALWFAVENCKYDYEDGQFWVFTAPDRIHLTDTRDNYYKKDLNKLDKTYLINAPIYWSEDLSSQIGDIRRQRQFGKFTISPYEKAFIPLEKQAEISPYLEKYCIKSEYKKQIRIELESNGINEDWLYYRDADKKLLKKFNKMKTSP